QRCVRHSGLIHTQLATSPEIVSTEKVDIDIVNEEWLCGVSAGRYPNEETLDGGGLREGLSGHDPPVPSGIIDHTRIEKCLGGVTEEGRERHAFRQRQRRGVLSCPHVDMAVSYLDKMSGAHCAMCVRRAETICRAMPIEIG